MSRTIDERIVDMQFNNRQFEDGIKNSLDSIDSLKKGLNNIDGAGKGLDGVGDSANKLGIDFDALAVIAVTALARITSAAMDFGINALKSMTLEPIIDGFKEYELKMQSVQTIMVNTAAAGTTMADVTKVLDELNDYADQTVFSFADMTQAISRLTASGVKLEDAAGAIKGISNVTAAVGGNLQNANTAFLQLGQSISSGRLQYQDWRSVMQAGLGGPVLQNELMAVAVAAGEMSQGLMDSVQNGKASFTELIKATGKAGPQVVFSTETMLKALNNLAEDPSLLIAATEVKTFTQLMGTLAEQSGSAWAETWENIIGNKDEAVLAWTAVNNAIESIIGPIHEGRNAALGLWKDIGGRDILIEAISNAFNALLKIITPIKEAFIDIFPSSTVKNALQLLELTKGFKEFTASLIISDKSADNIRRTFAGLFAALELVGKAIGFVFNVAGLLLSVFLPMGDGVLGVTAGIGDFIVALNDAAKINDVFGKALGVVGEVFNKLKTDIQAAKDVVVEFVKQWAQEFLSSDIVATVKEEFKNLADAIIDGLSGGLVSGIPEVIVAIINVARDMIRSFCETFGIKSPSTVMMDLGGDIVDGLLIGLKKGFANIGEGFKILIDSLKNIALYIWDIIGPALGYLKEALSDITFGDIASVLAGGGVFMIGKSLLGVTDSLKDISKSFVDILDGIAGSLEAFQTKVKSEAILNIAFAIGLLAGAILLLSLIDSEDLYRGLMALTIIFTELAISLSMLQKATITSQGLSTQLISMGVAILIIATAMAKLSKLDQAGMSQGIQGLSAVMLLLTTFIKLTKGGLQLQASATALVGLATSIIILSFAVEKFGQMDSERLSQGIQGLAAAMGILAVFIKLVGAPERMVSLGAGLMGVAVAMAIFAGAVALFGVMPVEMLQQGLLGVAGALMAIAAATLLMPDGATMLAIGIGLNLMAIALLSIAGVVAIFGAMSIESLVIGISALAAALVVIALAANLLTGTLAGAAALLVLALAINLLVPAIMLFSTMDIEAVKIALIMLAGMFLALGASAAILAPLSPVILVLASSILILGAGIYTIGAGLVLFAAGIAALAVGGTAFAEVFIKMVDVVAGGIPIIATKLAEGLGAFAKTLETTLPGIFETVKAIFTGLINVLIELTPQIVEGIIVLITRLLETLVEHGPALADAGMKLLMALLMGVSDHIQDIVIVTLAIIEEFLRGLAAGLPGVASAGMDIVLAFMTAIGTELPRFVDAGFEMIISLINGFADAIDTNWPLLEDAFHNLGTSIMDALTGGLWSKAATAIDTIKDIGGKLIAGFCDVLGIKSPSTVMMDAAKDMVDGLSIGLDEGTTDIEKAGQRLGTAADQGTGANEGSASVLGSQYGEAFASSLGSTQSNALSSGQMISTSAEDGIGSNSSMFGTLGGQYGTDFFTNLMNTQTSANTAGTDVTNKAEEGLKSNQTVFGQSGTTYGQDFSKGISDKQTDANTAGKEVAVKAEQGIKSNVGEFYQGGKNAGQGFVAGLEAMIQAAAEAAAEMAREASRAANRELDIRSPSRVFKLTGINSGLGLVNGLHEMAGAVGDAGADLASSAVDGVQTAINKIAESVDQDIETNPVITPVLDLSNIQNGSEALKQMLSGSQAVTPIVRNLAAISAHMDKRAEPLASEDKQTELRPSISLTQNNYSPKALNRLEIYRQTNSQLARLKGVVEGT